MPAIVAVMIAALALCAPAGAAHATVDDFTFESFDGQYYLSRSTANEPELYTVETLVALFPDVDQNRGLVRALPKTQSGIDLDTDVVNVTGEAGTVIPWWTEEDDDWVYVLTGDDTYLHGRHTFIISYTMDDVVIRYPDTDADEFSWDTVGVDHPQPIQKMTATVHLTGEVAADYRDGSASCYQGPENSTKRCEIVGPEIDRPWPSEASTWASWHGATAAGAQSLSVSAGPLAGGENVTVALGFTSGAFAAGSPPPPAAVPWWTLALPFIALAGGLLALPLGLLLRARARRNPDNTPVIARYTPPEDESLTLSAGALDVPARALAAHTVDLAVRDKIEIRADGERSEPDDFELVLTDPSGLDHDDRRVVEVLFGRKAQPKASVSLRTFAVRPPKRAVTYVRRIDEFTLQRGYRAPTPAWAARLFQALRYGALAIGVLTVFGVIPAQERGAPGWLWWLTVSLCLVSFVVLSIFRMPTTVLTRAGGEHVHELAGIREYLELAEEDRLKAAQSPQTAELVSSGRRAFGDDSLGTVVNLYERLLPYAVLFGLERQWAEVIRTRLPVPEVATQAALLDVITSRALAEASTSVGRLSATPVSAGTGQSWSSSSSGWSSSGSSFGGGFSGGGGGGGGIGGR